MSERRRRYVVRLGLISLVVVIACANEPPPEGASYLLLEGDGLAVQGEDGAYTSALPQQLLPGEELTVVTPDGELALTAGTDEVLRVRQDGTVERIPLDEVDAGRVEIDGDPAAIAALADEIGAELEEPEEGSEDPTLLLAPDVLAVLAAAIAPDGLTEVRPVGLEEEETIETPTVAPAPTEVVPTAPEAIAPASETVPVVVVDPKLEIPVGLPPVTVSTAGCADPALGTWRSVQYSRIHGGWYDFTLHVRAGRGEELRGEILSHFWRGSPSDRTEPTSCQPYGEEWTVRMPATGTRAKDTFELGGQSWSVAETTCGHAPTPGQYLLDRFTGGLTIGADELKTVNNDGGVMVNYPTAFVRVSCGG